MKSDETKSKLMFEPPDTSPDLQSELVSLAAAIDTHPAKTHRGNQRRHRRIAMSRAKACVQRTNSQQEFVELVDVSCGGACFRSEQVYALGSWIRIAAPCTVGAANIFVRARVVRAHSAPTGREYGVEYDGVSG